MPNVVMDAGFLIPLIEMGALKGDIVGGFTDDDVDQRLRLLLNDLSKSKSGILIPTPALTECLVKRPDKGPDLIEKIRKSRHFEIAEFGAAAALQCSELVAHHLPRRAERKKVISKSKIKFDLQILSIAMIKGASAIYTLDGDLATFAQKYGIKAFSFVDLPTPNPEQPYLPLHRPRALILDDDKLVRPASGSPTGAESSSTE